VWYVGAAASYLGQSGVNNNNSALFILMPLSEWLHLTPHVSACRHHQVCLGLYLALFESWKSVTNIMTIIMYKCARSHYTVQMCEVSLNCANVRYLIILCKCAMSHYTVQMCEVSLYCTNVRGLVKLCKCARSHYTVQMCEVSLNCANVRGLIILCKCARSH
jgi:hypothetical protein